MSLSSVTVTGPTIIMSESPESNSKIYVAGHNGLVGSAILRSLTRKQYTNLIVRSHSDLDLTDQKAVQKFFNAEKPEFVILAAAKVGGIYANSSYPAEFIHTNLEIQTNIIHQSYVYNVKRLLFLGSSCIYPRDCKQPIKEDYLLTGPLEPTNRSYAIAKIAGIEMCRAYNKQYGTDFIAAMPTNVYGPGDNYDLENSHVLPALIRKMHEGKINNRKSVSVWGTGRPRREFIYSDELADACVYLLNLPNDMLRTIVMNGERAPLVNIGCGKDMSVMELAVMIKEITGYSGELEWDTSKPDGTPRKLLDISLIRQTGWEPSMSVRKGIEMTYQSYLDSLKLQ